MTNQTPESVIAEAMVNAGAPLMHSRVEERVAAALRAANMLREPGVPDAATEQAKQELAACLDLRAYWRGQSVKARSERDAALAAIERVRAIHEPIPIYEGAESCGHTDDEHTTFESDQGIVLCENSPLGYSICGGCSDDSSADGPVEHPCPTIAALEEAPEPEVKP